MCYTIYGLVNCDTTKKALKWFTNNKIKFVFNNNRTEHVPIEKLKNWCEQKGWEKLLNKKGTAFKLLHTAIQKAAINQEKAIEIMLARPSTIKRPIIEKNNKIITLGFNELQYKVYFLD
jgi:arsenate reductase